jgi:hypothetical protein
LHGRSAVSAHNGRHIGLALYCLVLEDFHRQRVQFQLYFTLFGPKKY